MRRRWTRPEKRHWSYVRRLTGTSWSCKYSAGDHGSHREQQHEQTPGNSQTHPQMLRQRHLLYRKSEVASETRRRLSAGRPLYVEWCRDCGASTRIREPDLLGKSALFGLGTDASCTCLPVRQAAVMLLSDREGKREESKRHQMTFDDILLLLGWLMSRLEAVAAAEPHNKGENIQSEYQTTSGNSSLGVICYHPTANSTACRRHDCRPPSGCISRRSAFLCFRVHPSCQDGIRPETGGFPGPLLARWDPFLPQIYAQGPLDEVQRTALPPVLLESTRTSSSPARLTRVGHVHRAHN